MGPLCPLCRRRGGSQTSPPYLYPLAPVGEGLAPSRRFCSAPFDLVDISPLRRRAPFGAIQKGRKDRRGWPRRPLWAANDGPPRTPVYEGAWFGSLAQIYRRGVASDTTSFSRPLPLCGGNWRAVRATRLDAPPLVGPPWCGECRMMPPCGARPLGAPFAGVPCVPTPSFRGPGGAVGIRSLLTGLRIATSGLWPSSQ